MIMIIQESEEYKGDDGGRKSFKVIEYCCGQMGRDMKESRDWSIENNEMQCWDYESGFSGKFCSHCGQKIQIIYS